MKTIHGAALLASLLALAGPCVAAQYPDRPVRLIVPYTPGGGADILARITADKLAASFGWRILVDNRPGAGGNIGAELVAKSAPDGYTLLFGHAGPLAVNPHLSHRTPYDPVKDFAGVALIGSTYNFLVVHPGVPAKSVGELISLARRRPDDVSYASGGVGTGSFLAAELFKNMAGVRMAHIPYKGNAPALMDVISGQVPVMFPSMVTAAPHVKAGRLKLLAVTTAKRIAELPEVAAMGETLPGYEASVWYGVVAPANTPQQILQTLNDGIRKVLRPPEVVQRLAEQGVELATGGTADFDGFIRSEFGKWGKVVRASGLSIN